MACPGLVEAGLKISMGIGGGASIYPGLAVHQSFLKGVGVDWHARGDSGRNVKVWGETGGSKR